MGLTEANTKSPVTKNCIFVIICSFPFKIAGSAGYTLYGFSPFLTRVQGERGVITCSWTAVWWSDDWHVHRSMHHLHDATSCGRSEKIKALTLGKLPVNLVQLVPWKNLKCWTRATTRFPNVSAFIFSLHLHEVAAWTFLLTTGLLVFFESMDASAWFFLEDSAFGIEQVIEEAGFSLFSTVAASESSNQHWVQRALRTIFTSKTTQFPASCSHVQL